MKVAIVGPGAIGCLAASFLKEVQQDVVLIDKYPKRAEAIDRDGVVLEYNGQVSKTKVKATAYPHNIDNVELLIVCVKSYDTDSAIDKIEELPSKPENILTFQNGLGNIEKLSKCVNEDRIIAGVTQAGATLVDTGYVKYAGGRKTFIGKVGLRNNSHLQSLKTILDSTPLEIKISSNIKREIWQKLIINASINPLSAIYEVKNGELIKLPDKKKMMKEIIKEAVNVARREQIFLSCKKMFQKVVEVCNATSDNYSSMLQDVMKGKRTEINYINGAIVRLAEEYGIEVPVNRDITKRVNKKEKERRKTK